MKVNLFKHLSTIKKPRDLYHQASVIGPYHPWLKWSTSQQFIPLPQTSGACRAGCGCCGSCRSNNSGMNSCKRSRLGSQSTNIWDPADMPPDPKPIVLQLHYSISLRPFGKSENQHRPQILNKPHIMLTWCLQETSKSILNLVTKPWVIHPYLGKLRYLYLKDVEIILNEGQPV